MVGLQFRMRPPKLSAAALNRFRQSCVRLVICRFRKPRWALEVACRGPLPPSVAWCCVVSRIEAALCWINNYLRIELPDRQNQKAIGTGMWASNGAALLCRRRPPKLSEAVSFWFRKQLGTGSRLPQTASVLQWHGVCCFACAHQSCWLLS